MCPGRGGKEKTKKKKLLKVDAAPPSHAGRDENRESPIDKLGGLQGHLLQYHLLSETACRLLVVTALPELQHIDETGHAAASSFQKVPFKNLLGRRAVFHIDGQALTQKHLQFPTEPIRVFERRGSVGRDEEQSLQWLFVEIWRFRLDHFNRHDPQGPHVHLGAVFLLLDDFRGHPVRGANHGGTLRLLIREFGTKAKVGCRKRRISELC